MIIADTNIIIDYLKNPTAKTKKIFLDNEIAVCGITEAELIHGTRDETQIKDVVNALSNFNRIKIEDSLWSEVGILLHKLKKNGVSVPFQDAVICVLALQHNLTIWSKDKHFKMIQKVFPDLVLM
jgi:predicted nucleic acid-binding protein